VPLVGLAVHLVRLVRRDGRVHDPWVDLRSTRSQRRSGR